MRPTLLRLLLIAIPILAVSACSTTRSCSTDEAYLKAQERPPLDLPPDVNTGDRIQPVVIPPTAANPEVLDPQPRCLDYPPQYFARKPGSAPSVDATVRAWGAAWAARKPDVVLQGYSPSFQSPGTGGAAAFLAEREEQVATGAAPSPELQDLKVTNDGDRRVVTFTQAFGSEKVRRELTLVRDGPTWRIVAERTLGPP